MPNMTESNAEGHPVYCPHCGRIAFFSGHSTLYSETPMGGQIAAQSGKAFFLCTCGIESETEISRYTGRLYLREVNQWRPRSARSNGGGNRGGYGNSRGR